MLQHRLQCEGKSAFVVITAINPILGGVAVEVDIGAMGQTKSFGHEFFGTLEIQMPRSQCSQLSMRRNIVCKIEKPKPDLNFTSQLVARMDVIG